MDQAAEIDQLRRRAYSRSGTDDDRRRLAELEAFARAVAVTPVVEPAEPVDEHVDGESADASATEHPATDETPKRPSRWLAAALGAAVGAGLATVTTLALVTVSASAPKPAEGAATALAVFDREPSQADDLSNLLFPLDALTVSGDGTTSVDPDDVALRSLGMAAGNDVYAARVREGDGYTICLIVSSAEGGAAACTPETAFVANGVRMGAFGTELKWGPEGTEVWVHSYG